MLHIRPYRADDREFVLGLAERLALGIQPWRDTQKMVTAAQGWIEGSLEQHGQKAMVFVAEDDNPILRCVFMQDRELD